MRVPYYQDDQVTLYHGDCLEVTEWLAADVLVTDPPYGIGWTSDPNWTNAEGKGGWRGTGNAIRIANDKTTDARDKALDLWGGRHAVVFGDVLKPPPSAVQMLVYAKPVDAGIKGARAGWRKDVEGIYLLGPWSAGIGGRSSVIRTSGRVAGPRGMGLRAGHPHAKPLDVLEELIDACPPGTIADPFAGSGSTLVAARNLGRKAIGVELEERYCEIIAKRLDQMCLDIYAIGQSS